MNALAYKSDEEFTAYQFPLSYDNPSPTLPNDRELALEGLKILSYLEKDWNGYGAAKPLAPSIGNASSFIKKIPLDYKAPNKLYSDDEGHVVLVWKQNNSRLIVTVETVMLHFTFEQDGQKTVLQDNILFNGELFPQEIKKHLPNLDHELS